MSRHLGTGSGAPNIPRSAAERRVLEQLQAQSAFPTRRTLPRPAATSPLSASEALVGASDTRVRRPRSRIFGATAASTDGEASILQDILDEFPEIDHTTVSVLLSMHNGRRSPVVQRLAEVYRVPGKPPQKRHSFPASAHRGALTQQSRPQSARTRRPFSVDRIDDDDEEEIHDEEMRPFSSNVGETPSIARGAVVPLKGALHFTATSSGRRQPTSRRKHDDSSQNSQSSSKHRHRHRSRRHRGNSDGFASAGDDPAPRTSATSPRYEERASEPLLAPWGQEHAPRGRGDATPPVTLPPAILRSRSISSPGTQPPFAVLHSAHTPVLPEESAVRLRARPFTNEDDRDDQGPMDEEGSVSSSGTSSNTRGSPAVSSAKSSVRSSVPSSTRGGGSVQTVSTRDGRESDSSHRDGRDSTRAAAAAVLRGVVGGHRNARHHGTETGGGAEGLSRRQRGALSVRSLGHAVRDGLSRSLGTRESGSEDDVDEGDGGQNRANGDGELEEYGRDEGIERGVEYGDGSEDATLRTVGIQELLLLRGDTSEVSGGAAEGSDGGGSGYVRVEVAVLQGLVRKLDVAERALSELQHESKERVAELLRAVNTVSSSLSHYDERQQKRSDTLRAVFTGNNDSIERLHYTMVTIRSELRDYETRRSRRFWRMIGLKVLDLMAYVALGLVWLCASVYNLGTRQRRAFTRLVQGVDDEEVKDASGFKRHASFEAAAEEDGGEREVEEDDRRFGALHGSSEYESVPSEEEIVVEGEEALVSSDAQ